MEKKIAIITARGGSKRIPKKNIKYFLEKPIIQYSIEAAINSNCFDEVMVSTDDDEIARIAASFGAKIPFKRSVETSNDHSTTADVLIEVLNEYKKIDQEFKYCCCIYPTAPFITKEKLNDAYNQLIKSGAETLVPVVRFGFPILRSFKINDGLLKLNWPEFMNSRSQDLPLAFHDCGQFYFFEVESFLKHKKLFTEFTVPFEMPESEVQDIDSEEDWRIAEIKYTFLMEKMKKSNV
jgi:N-acylneuraminate cytidylyltransferase